jgi:broad specificity phosphatase PhoE
MDAVFLADFRRTVDTAAARLLALTSEQAAARPAPGKWSPKEIIGHLIDSASNNHGRFVRAQLQDDLRFDGYEQEDWVEVQRYQERAWVDLIALWQALNHHIAHVMAAADPEALARPRARHNLDALAWQPVSAAQPTSLEYFMRDYVGHLKHHLAQIR